MSVYACSDLHGRLDLFNEIQKFLKLDDTVYFLGDAGDRGPKGWETIKAIAADNRFIYIKGNHEDMLVKAMEDDIKYDHLRDFNFNLLLQNDGGNTFFSWELENDQIGWWSYLKRLPTFKTYVNQQGIRIYLSHAGFNPLLDNAIPNEEDLLWDRTHFLGNDAIFDADEMVVHGHTPIPYLIARTHWSNECPAWEKGAWWYNNDHKVDLDCGSWATGNTILLDLDTFDEHIFEIEKESV